MKKHSQREGEHPEWTGQDDKFVAAAAKRFRLQTESLDAHTRSRLNRARQAALAELDGTNRSSTFNWRPVVAVAATGGVAALLWFGNQPLPPAQTGDELLVAQQPDQIADLDLMLASENLSMLEDIEFFTWLDASLTEEELEAELEAVS
jgi:hypothetical protein